MAALETLLDVETEIEGVFTTLLSSAPYSLAATATDTAQAVTTPRVECVTEVLRWGPHQITPTAGAFAGTPIYDQFHVRTSISVVFQPEHAQGQASIRGKARRALSDWTRIKSGFATNNYLMPAGTTLQQTDGGRTVDNEEKTETLKTVLEFVVFLNPNALNAAT